jgi:tetrahydromethanopterin S-methyltransferase subunit B
MAEKPLEKMIEVLPTLTAWNASDNAAALIAGMTDIKNRIEALETLVAKLANVVFPSQ